MPIDFDTTTHHLKEAGRHLRHAAEGLFDAIMDSVTVDDATATPEASPGTYAPIKFTGPSMDPEHVKIGVLDDGTDVTIDIATDAHILIAGHTGAGKSVLQHNILAHALRHDSLVATIDIANKDEYKYLHGAPGNVFGYAQSLPAAKALVNDLVKHVDARHAALSKHALTEFADLPDSPRRVFLFVDDLYYVLTPDFVASEGSEERNRLREEITEGLESIARHGGPVGVHLILSTQRPNPEQRSAELDTNITTRIVVGHSSETLSHRILGTHTASRLPYVQGRAVVSVSGKEEQFSVPFLSRDDLVAEYVKG